ncbi:hypothetical protein AGOR_G00081700 [Albula goreensis]|uniref:Ig-like domain-containing protein n=1 Tax=Albula goreensis TaxID=1534307 RepID=A0A8T3DJY2_9TELE|nr:hypothetical protein AGOR_G00081700 [Albula goreensis]
MSHRDTQRHRGVLERMDRETVLLLHLLLIKVHFYTGVSTYDMTWQYQYGSAAQHGGDAPVRLSVLSISPSSPVTELKSGSTVTLHCLLYTPEGPGQCKKDSAKTIKLSWMDKSDTPLNKSRFKIENWPPCNSTLTVKLQQKGNNRKWRCQLTEGSDVKISHSFTTILSGTTAGLVLGCVILCLAVAVTVIYRRRGTGSHPTANQDPGQNADNVTYSDINHSNRTTRLKDKDSAEELTEYATINTAH